MIALAITFTVGAATGAVAAWWVKNRGGDDQQVEVFQLRRHLANLREVNTKLSMRCGHCGTGRAVPADRQTGGAL
ncbi:hypothetical protein [Nocardiopsis sp. YSL2]|uniref:hypothetical protein n=1 Tax=Nocardiopsis sp. YSL2 TaxID=2939492 RepID=UPI0026F43E7E|nr:hypothetical protein [Nocardiopsis sp. YSL2]